MIDDHPDFDEIDDHDYHLKLYHQDLRLLHSCVEKSIQSWPGGDPREQEAMFVMRDILYKGLLEHQYHQLNVDVDKE